MLIPGTPKDKQGSRVPYNLFGIGQMVPVLAPEKDESVKSILVLFPKKYPKPGNGLDTGNSSSGSQNISRTWKQFI